MNDGSGFLAIDQVEQLGELSGNVDSLEIDSPRSESFPGFQTLGDWTDGSQRITPEFLVDSSAR